jgi:hypothetical protein
MNDQMKLLKRLAAPKQLIESFEEVCRINSMLPDDMKSSFTDLLEGQCRNFGFHDILPEGWFFRPYSLGEEHSHYDTAVGGSEVCAPVIEQAYRRGYVQGFGCSRKLDKEGASQSQLDKEEARLQKWRVRTVQQFRSSPGSNEKPPRKLFGGRSALSLRLRYRVFERDNFKCKICGREAQNDLTLEIDHIVAIAKGGFDEMANLRTLCSDCNRGKSDS